MGQTKVSVNLETVAKAQEELAKIKDGKLAVQLKAIIASSQYSVETVAGVLTVSRRSVFRWIKKFKEQSVTGLKDQPKGHLPAKLNKEHKEQLEQWILKGENARGKKVHWTLKKLKGEVKKEFGMSIGTTSLWNQLKRMGLSLKKPRPVHAKADAQRQEAFKKTFL
jgi:transposase